VPCGSPDLHVCTSSIFLVNMQRCDGDWYRFVLPLPKTRTFCASGELTVLVLAHLQDCAAAAGVDRVCPSRSNWSRRGGDGSASQFAEREWPYDTASSPRGQGPRPRAIELHAERCHQGSGRLRQPGAGLPDAEGFHFQGLQL
jgi:hypothetical protein